MLKVNKEIIVHTSKEMRTQGYNKEFYGKINFYLDSYCKKNKISEALKIKYSVLEGEL